MPSALPRDWLAPARVIGLLGILSAGAACGTSTPPPPEEQSGQGDVASLLASADSAYAAGDDDTASARFTRILDVSRRRGDLESEASALISLGSIAWRRDSYPAARILLGRALDLQHRHGLSRHLYRNHNVFGLVAFKEGRYYEALEWHRVAAELAAAASDTISLAKSWNNVALTRTELGDFDEARRLLLLALPVARASGQRLTEGRVLVNLGMLAVRTGDPETAIRYLDSARTPLAEVGDAAGEMNRLGQLGTAYAEIGEPGRAIAYLDTALTEARARDSPQEAASNLEHMAAIYRAAGDFPRALRLFEEARSINESLALDDEAAFDLRGTADIHRELGNVPLARRSTERALAMHRRVGNRLEILHDLLLLARLAHDAGEPDSARSLLRTATGISDTLDARTPRLAVGITAARLADEDGNDALVLRTLAGTRDDLTAGGTDLEWEYSWLEGRAHSRLGHLDRATTVLEAAVASVERVRGEFGSPLLRTGLLAARDDVYRDLVDVLLRRGQSERAFEAADASRGRVLLDHLATLRTNGAATVRELAEEERQLLRQIDAVTVALDRLQSRVGVGAPAALQSERERLTSDLERIRGEYAVALTRAEERSGPGLALAGATWPRTAEVQAALRPGSALLEYFLLSDRLVAFLVTREGVTWTMHPVGRDVLAARVRVVRELTGRPGSVAAVASALEALHEALMGAPRRGERLAGISTLFIVPDAELEYLPFAALRDPRTGRYLIEDFSLLTLPSAAMLPALRHRAEAERSREVVALAPFPAALPASAGEVDAVVRALPGTVAVQGRAASEARVRIALARGSIVHIATHGVLNARNPLFSRIELAPGKAGELEDDGRLEVHEVNRMDLRAWLIFLSGCETGLGVGGSSGFHSGEDYATLTRAFLKAGVANVIATLWRVEDRGAAMFAERFYRELGARDGKDTPGHDQLALALSRAQRDLLRDPKWADPYYWAGFRLTGTGDEPAARSRGVVRS